MMTAEERDRLLKRLNGPSRLDANAAGREIVEQHDPAFVRPVIRILRGGHRVYNRIEAAYTLGQLSGTARTIALERCLSNRTENPQVRAFAAEALCLGHRGESHDVLLKHLKDRSAEVRFWCAYSLGEMKDRKALATLQWLAENDKRSVKGWWSVQKEALDAIANIRSSRARRCMYCSSGT